MERAYKYGLILSLLVGLAGCNPYKQDSFQPQYSIQAYLVANASIPPIRLVKTLPASGSSSSSEVPDAQVTVTEVNAQGSVLHTFPYRYDGGTRYIPMVSSTVVPGYTYKLNIDVPSYNQPIQARCTIPGAFQVKLAGSAAEKYQRGSGITLLSTQSQYPGRGAYYVIAAVAQQPDSAHLTPYFLNKVENDSYTPTSSLTKISSRIFNQGDFQTDTQSNLIIPVPWDIFAFYGENQLVIYTLDDNTYDFLRSLDVQYGSTQVTPGQLYNLIYHVKGGIGLFGGLATDTVMVTITH